MTIPAASQPQVPPQIDTTKPIVDLETGLPTEAFVQLFQQLRSYGLGSNRVIPCTASGTNVITLTPLEASPEIRGYYDYDIFVFAAEITSTGAVTATVVPKKGTLSTLKVYKTNGAAQAGSGDVVANSLYLAIYADHLDGGAGGFVLK